MLNNQEEQEFQEVNAAKYMYDNGEDKHFVVSAEIYPYDIFCFFGSKTEAYKTLNIYESLGIISSAENIKDSENFFAMSPDGFSLLYVENVPNSINTLAILNHEIWHIADEILRSVGIKSSRETCEVYAYFIQFLSERIYEKLGLVVAMISEEIPSGVDIISHQKGEQNDGIEDLKITNHNQKIQHLKEGMNILVCESLETKITKIVDDKIYFIDEFNKEIFETIDAIKIVQ